VRALLDEHLTADLALELRSRGLDVEAINARPAMRGAFDDQVMELAVAEERAVVTNNIKDFRPIAAARMAEGAGHAGLILLPSTRSRSRSAINALADGIETIMRANPNGLEGSERWVAPLQ